VSHKLVTLLGKASSNYRQATYEFEDSSRRTSRFFGLELCKHVNPDELVILGTTGSMWDNLLLETELSGYLELEEELLSLGEAAQNDAVTQDALDQLATHLKSVLGIPCVLKLIPYGRTQQEQTETLEILVNCFSPNDTATLDVTHGLRHLPMLIQQSALVLRSLKDVSISGIHYGALDLTAQDITPVMRLDGLLELDRWNQALAIYDESGDYGSFIPLLEKSGFSKNALDSLRDAAFYEQTNSVQKAYVKLRNFLALLRKEEAVCSPHSALFLPALKQRFLWVERDEQHQRQAAVAWQALENDNLLRATLYGFEAFMTKLAEQESNGLESHDVRRRVKDDFEKSKPTDTWQAYQLLRGIRNHLAHSSSQSHSEVKKAVASRTALSLALKGAFDVLIPN
jgi:CRISPR-associated Csx2 family protein